MKKPVLTSLAVAVLAMTAFGANAADANVTNNVIFGSGVTNGNFTVNTSNGVELGLRARVRFDDTNLPTNDNASNGNGTYQVPGGNPNPGFGFQPNSSSSAKWNFDWSINTGTASVGAYTYQMSIDFDPGVGTNFMTFDLINGVNPDGSGFWDHSFGDNNTGMGQGAEATDAATYLTLKNSNNLVQNSWNYEFFDNAMFPFNGGTAGAYTILLTASNSAGVVSSNQIVVNVPEPGSLALIGLGLTGLAVSRRRKQAK